ncbi:MAG: inositol monophosphatase family protein [Candidatus Dojkabacteria bacterium]
MNLEESLKFAEEFAYKEGDRVLSEWSNVSISKTKEDGADLATNFDRELEKKFYEMVREAYPGTGFYGEEFPELIKEAEYVWTVDPIDGSKPFAAGVPMWCTTISLLKNGSPVLGLVYNPVSRQMYKAIKGNGSYLNGKRLSVKVTGANHTLQVASDQSMSFSQLSEIGKDIYIRDKFKQIQDNFYRQRILGTGTLSVAWVAQGYFSGYFDPYRPDAKMIDIYAPMLIAEEAGAKVHVAEVDKGYYAVVIASPSVFDDLVELL